MDGHKTNYMLRLRNLREDRDLKQSDIGKILNVTSQTIANYELGNREPGIRELIILSDFFGVSIDYLVGRTNKK